MKTLKKFPILVTIMALSLVPFLYLFTQTQVMGGFQYAVGNILGLLGATLMWWQFVLGIRFISSKITTDLVSINSLHKALGKYGAMLALTHPFLQMLTYNETLSFVFFPKQFPPAAGFETNVAYGRIAFYLLMILFVSSIFLRKKLGFRPWKYIHYLAYPILFATFWHASAIGTFISSFTLIHAYWVFLTYSFYAILLYRLSQVFDIGKKRYVVEAKQTITNGITQYTLIPKSSSLVPKVGQFIYIKPWLVGEAHPFTVMKYSHDTGQITLGVKTEGKFTQKMKNVLMKGKTVSLDGPYGVFTREGHSGEPKVIIAGGIGVTPFVDLVEKYGDKDTYMFYSNRELASAVGRDGFKKKLGKRYMDIITREDTNEAVVKGRMTKATLQKALDTQVILNATFFVCGSASFMDGIKDILADLGVSEEHIYSEEFSL